MEYDNMSEIFNYEMFNDTSVAVGCHHFGRVNKAVRICRHSRLCG